MHKRWRLMTALVGLLLPATLLWAREPQRRPDVSLGIGVQPAQGGTGQGGLVVRQVDPNGPAAKAGVEAGDVILKAGDKEVNDFEDLVNVLARHKPGDKLALEVRRQGQEKNVEVTLGARRRSRPLQPGEPVRPRGAFLGVQTGPLTADARERLGVTVDQGAVVRDVVPNTPAARAGLKADDVITDVDGKPVTDPVQLRQAIQQAGPGKEVTLKVARGKESKEVRAKLEEVPSDVFPLPLPGFGPEGLPGPGGLLPQDGRQRIDRLERQVQDLEKRVRELEQKQSPPPK